MGLGKIAQFTLHCTPTRKGLSSGFWVGRQLQGTYHQGGEGAEVQVPLEECDYPRGRFGGGMEGDTP